MLYKGELMVNEKAKTRFCPSPTGFIHLGNARTALFNFLLAKKLGGIFLLRIEDTDIQRSKQEYTETLQEDLLWLNLKWQEGPGQELGSGPYFQSQRRKIYDEYYHILEGKGAAYPCFCTEEELALMRKMQRSAGKPPRYPGTCFKLSQDQVKEKLAQGLKPTLRFHVPNSCVIEFNDLVRGPQKFSSQDIGDFIIRRADGTSPFMFSNAIDDALMGVVYVLRGEDHLTNTPRQIMILQALDLPILHYGHISLIVGPDGSPLSKRHGSRSIQELRKSGFFPEAVNNYMARLGHYYENDELMTLEELAENFKSENLGKSPTKYNYQQLVKRQQEVIATKSIDQLWECLEQRTKSLVPGSQREEFIAAVKPNIIFPEDAHRYAEIFFSNTIKEKITEQQKVIFKEAGSRFFEVAIAAVQAQGQDFKAVSQQMQTELKIKGKSLFQPLRVALTGELHGPEMAAIFKILPVNEIISRLSLAGSMT
jgi:glutamyl-tRNA synthetase